MTTDTPTSGVSDLKCSALDKRISVSDKLLSCSYPRRLRLRRRGQFLRVQRVGKRVYTQHLITYIALNSGQRTRLGVTVSKKMGKAHTRNYIKRLLRESFRQSEIRNSKGFDISVISRHERPPSHLETLIAEMNELASMGRALVEAGRHTKSKKRSRSQNRHTSSNDRRDRKTQRNPPVDGRGLARSDRGKINKKKSKRSGEDVRF